MNDEGFLHIVFSLLEAPLTDILNLDMKKHVILLLEKIMLDKANRNGCLALKYPNIIPIMCHITSISAI